MDTSKWIGSYYVKSDGAMAANELVYDPTYNSSFYFDENGKYLNKQWKEIDGEWYYFKDGKAVTGRQNIDGKEYYFDKLGRQVKGSPISTPKGVEYYESVLGERVTNTWITFQDGKTVFFDENGYADFDK